MTCPGSHSSQGSGSGFKPRQSGSRAFALAKCMTLSISHVRLFSTPWTVAHQAPLSMGFPRQEYWSGLPFSSLGDLPDPGIEPESPALQADSLLLSSLGRPWFALLG